MSPLHGLGCFVGKTCCQIDTSCQISDSLIFAVPGRTITHDRRAFVRGIGTITATSGLVL